MQYLYKYRSPLGDMTLAANSEALIGAWFDEQKYFASTLLGEYKESDLPLFHQVREWLERYFKGGESGKYPASAAAENITLPPGSLETPSENPLWTNHHLWLYRKKKWLNRVVEHTWRHRQLGEPWDIPDQYLHPLPSRRRQQWEPYRICRRHSDKRKAPLPGRH